MKPDRSSVSSATDILSITPARPAGTSRKRTPIAHAAGQTAAQCVELLETRALQTADPVMGPLESPEALQNEIDVQTSHLQTLEQSYAATALELEHLQEDRAELDDDHAEKTGQIETLTAEQAARTLQMSALEQQIEETDARIATLEASGGAFAVNWLSESTSLGTVPGTNGKESFAVTVSLDGAFIARGDRAGTVELIDTVTGQRLFTAQQSGYVCDLAFDETGRRLASVHTSGTIMIMDTQTHAITTRSIPNDYMYGSMQWIGDEICVSTQGNGIHVIHAQTGARRSIQSAGMVNGIARVGSDALFAAGPQGPVSLFSRQGVLLAQAPSPGNALTAAASRDGSMMAVVTWDGNVTVYNRSLQVIGQATGAGKGYRLSFLGNKGLVTYDANGRFLLFTLSEMQNGQLGSPQVLSTNPHQGFSNTMGVLPDGSALVNIDPNNGLRLTRMPAHLVTSTSAPALAAEQATRTGLLQSLETLGSAMTTAQAALTVLEQEKADLEIAALTSDTLLEEIDARLRELQEDIDDTQAQIQALQDRLDALDAVFIDMSPDTDALAAELSASIQSALDADAERIGYAKMHVSVENLSTGDTRLHIRFRNPGEQTVINMRIGDTNLGDVVAMEPTADGAYAITLRPTGGYGGEFVIQLQDGVTRQTIREIRGSYDRFGKTAHIATAQMSFDEEEAGMLAENPITPALHLGRMDQGTLLLVVETPFDQFYIDTTMAGILSTAEGSVNGGTTFGLAQITVDTGRPTGYHTIRLYDRKGGQVIDTLTVYFDQPSRTLSLANPSDQYSGSSSIEETDLGQQQQAMQALQNIPLGVAYADIARNQRLNLYYQTEHLPAPYNLYIDAGRMMDLLFATPQYAKYRPENIQQTIQQEWDNLGTYMEGDTLRHYYDYSHAQTNVELSKRQIVADFMGKLAVYEQGVSECVQAAVNIFLGITQGQPEEPLRQIYDALYAQWSANGIIRSLEGIGMSMPDTWTLRMAAKEVFYDHWEYLVQTQVDVQNVRAREEYFLSLGQLKDAEGNWHAATDIHSPTPMPAGMTASELRLAAKIERVIQSSAQLLARYTPIQRSKMIGTITALLEGSTTDQNIIPSILVAMNELDSDLHFAAPDIDSSITSPDAMNAFNTIKPVSQAILYRRVLRWFEESNGSLRSIFPIRTDSMVGKMMYAGSEELFDCITDEGRWEIAFTLQRLTDIPAQKFMDVLAQSYGSNVSFCSGMRELLVEAQYEELFPEHPRYFETPIFTGADPDIPATNGAYTDDRSEIRIRFDLVPTQKKMQKLEVISQGRVISTTTGAAFVKFNMLSVGHYGDNIHVTLRATFTDGTSIETESAAFNLHPGVVTGPDGFDEILSGVPENMKLTVSELLNIDLRYLSPSNKAILEYFINHYLKNGGLQFDANALGKPFELEGDMHGTLDDQCKAWLQKIIVPSAVSTDIPLNITKDQNGNSIVSYSWVMNSPDNNGRILSADGKTEQIASIRGSETFESMIQLNSVQAGDIIQMAYGYIPHTMVLWKKEAAGIWVFDTNFGEYGKAVLANNTEDATGKIDENGVYQNITDEEVQNGAIRTHKYQFDNTIRLHFLSYSDLNSKTHYATLYRIQ